MSSALARGLRLVLLALPLGSAVGAQVPQGPPAKPAPPADSSHVAPAGQAPAAAPVTPPAGPDELAPGQTPEQQSVPWRLSYYPILTGGANDGPMLTFRVHYWQAAPYEAPTTFNAALDGGAGIAPHGSRFIAATFRAPRLWPGWRLAVTGAAERQTRFGYFGLGNETVFNKDAESDSVPYPYRVRRVRYIGTVEITRWLHGPLGLALLAGAEHAHFTSLEGPSAFLTDFPSGELFEDDFTSRLALVYDTRDIDYNTHQGLLLEAGAQAGTGGSGYTRLYSILRGYLQIREGTVLAARIAGSGTGGSSPLDTRFYLPAWERPMPILGGQYSNRGLDTGRLSGEGSLFANLELRHDLLALGDLGAVTLLGFVDAGRVFEEEPFRFTTDGMKVSGGGGVAFRILRSTILVLNFATGPEGFHVSLGNGWMF